MHPGPVRLRPLACLSRKAKRLSDTGCVPRDDRHNGRPNWRAGVALVIAGVASPASGWTAAPTIAQTGLLLITLAALLGSSTGMGASAPRLQKK